MSAPEYVEYHVDWCGNTHTNEEIEQRNENLLFVLNMFAVMCWLAGLFTFPVAALTSKEIPSIMIFWILFAVFSIPLIYLLYINTRRCIRENVFCV
jgi:hypothetical protein